MQLCASQPGPDTRCLKELVAYYLMCVIAALIAVLCFCTVRLGLGLNGAAWAAVSIQSMLVVMLLGYLVFRCVEQGCVGGWVGGQVLQTRASVQPTL